MSFIKRLGYYLFGVSIGIIILSFIFSGKKTSCNYSPEARVKSQLLKKKITISNSITENNTISIESIKGFIKKSNINFSLSNTKKDSCKIYILNGYLSKKYSTIEVENCLKTITILKIDP